MRPLEGLRVVDLTRVLSGPYCTMQLGDLGAEVIKVERPVEGDDTRAFAPPYQGDEAAYFLSVNRNKKSITLDMKSERGREVLWRLIDHSDVLVENFRPGAMDRLGFGYAAVSARRPAMVYCSISGFGNTGLMKDRPGYDVIVQGEAGIQDITGNPDGAAVQGRHFDCRFDVRNERSRWAFSPRSMRPRRPAAASMCRSRCMKSIASLLSFNASIYFATGESPKRRGNAHATIVPYETFEASDGWISLGVANDELWKRFCGLVKRPELTDDPRFAKAADRVRNRDILVPIVKDIIKQRTRDEWLPLMDAAGIPSGGIRTVGEVCESELLKSRDMIAEMPHAGAGVGIVKNIKNPMHLSATPLNTYAAPPRLGEHTREVLTGLLGYSAAEVEDMARGEIV